MPRKIDIICIALVIAAIILLAGVILQPVHPTAVQPAQQQSPPKNVTIVYLYKPNDGGKTFMEPVVDDLAKNYSVTKIDTSQDRNATIRYDAQTTPMIIIMKGDHQEARFQSVEGSEPVLKVLRNLS